MARPRRLNKHLPKFVELNNGTYYYRPTHGESVRMQHADGSSIRHGEEPAMYAWLADKVEPVAMPDRPTLSQCFERYKIEVLPTLSDRTQRDYLRALDKLQEFFDPTGERHPDDIKPREVGQFLSVRKGKIHRNRMVAVLSAVYSKCVGRWYVAERNPCRDVERNESHKRTRYVTDAEFDLVRAAMPPRVQIAMDLALLTGQRQGDLLALRWESVKPEGIVFEPAKTRKKIGKRLLLTMTPAIEEVLTRAKRMVPQLPREYVIRTEAGTRYTAEGFRAIWQRRMRKLHRTGALPIRFTFHDLRAKTVSDSADLGEANVRAGHTSMSMTKSVYDRGTRSVKPLR